MTKQVSCSQDQDPGVDGDNHSVTKWFYQVGLPNGFTKCGPILSGFRVNTN